MNAKLIIIGGLAFYVVTWLVSFVTGPLVHEGLLADAYDAHSAFWRPELMQEPPDMAALMPRWITTGLLFSFVLAAVYGWVRPAIAGQGWVRGARFGFGLWLVLATTMATWTGIFNLPDFIWAWWAAEALAVDVLGGAALGWAVDRWVPARQ